MSSSPGPRSSPPQAVRSVLGRAALSCPRVVTVVVHEPSATSLQAAWDALLGLPERAPLALVVQRDQERVSLLLADPKIRP